MKHNLPKAAKLAALALMTLSSAGLTAGDAMARRYVDGRISVCGRHNIPVRVYAAERYYARPVVCGGGPVNANLTPDFQLNKGR